MAKALSYHDLPFHEITDELVAQCSKFFSAHYGVWGAKGPVPGKSVRLTPEKIRQQCLFNSEVRLPFFPAKQMRLS
jgi:hypothetical protein